MWSWLRRWRPRHLLASWLVYWLLLGVFTLGGAAIAAWRVTHLPKGQGTISANFGDGLVSLVISAAGKVVWEGSASLISIALLVAGPALVLWFLWILAQRRQPEAAGATARRERVGGR